MYYLVEFIDGPSKFKPCIMTASEVKSLFDNLHLGDACPAGIWRLERYNHHTRLYVELRQTGNEKLFWYLHDQWGNIEEFT